MASKRYFSSLTLRFKMLMLLCFFCFVIKCASAVTCPPLEDTSPCICLEQKSRINAFCSNIKSLEQISNSINGFAGREISSFHIRSSTFEYIPHDLFENLTVKEIEISKTKFSRIGNLGDSQFKGLENSLETLKITDAFKEKYPLPYLQIGHLNRLTTLEISDSQILVVNNHWFKNGPKSLKEVRFVKCKIRAIGYHAFHFLTNLRVIDLSDNALTYIPRWALPEPASVLEELNLERNKFETLPDDIFTDMPNLKIVNLELNEFSTINEIIWKPIWNHLELLNIDYNPIVCDQKIRWIYETKENLERKLVATCYKPFTIMERDLHSLKPEELGKTNLF